LPSSLSEWKTNVKHPSVLVRVRIKPEVRIGLKALAGELIGRTG
jgi:hypothetical protein